MASYLMLLLLCLPSHLISAALAGPHPLSFVVAKRPSSSLTLSSSSSLRNNVNRRRIASKTQSNSLSQRLQTDIQVINDDDNVPSDSEIEVRKQSIDSAIQQLEMSQEQMQDDNDKRFEPLLGFYDVSHVQTANQGENPVGGKWTRKNKVTQQILNIRRTFQHLRPTNSTGIGMLMKGKTPVIAEAVNIITFDAIFRLIRLNVILRGDAIAISAEERQKQLELNADKNRGTSIQTLSNLTVKAIFDPPRIVFGRTGRFGNFQLGPSTSVILDTTYIDDQIRIGMGGTSGTRFVFSRCQDDDDEAQDFLQMLRRKPVRRSRIVGGLIGLGGSGVWASVAKGYKVMGGTVAVLTGLVALALSLSSGGVEDDEDEQ
jgi:hypothetical protein